MMMRAQYPHKNEINQRKHTCFKPIIGLMRLLSTHNIVYIHNSGKYTYKIGIF